MLFETQFHGKYINGISLYFPRCL